MSDLLLLFKSIIEKDFKLLLTRKISIFAELFFVFIKIYVLFFISEYVSIESLKLSSSYFIYAIFGLCFLDILTTVVPTTSRELVNFKKTGLLEEIILIPSSISVQIIGLNLIQVLISVLKLCIYLFLGSWLANDFLIDVQFILQFLVTAFFLFLSFIFVGILAGSVTLISFRQSIIVAIYSIISLIFCGVYFPNESLPNSIEFISLFLVLEPALNIFRSLNAETYDLNLFLHNLMLLVLTTLIYGIIAINLFNKSLNFAKRHGTISIF
mgnify:CR=1 FL=1